jgi:hypothetical protein
MHSRCSRKTDLASIRLPVDVIAARTEPHRAGDGVQSG